MKLIAAMILLASPVAGVIAVQNPPPANSPQTIFVIAHSEKTTTVNVQVPTIRAEMEYQYFANLPGVSVAIRQNVNLIDLLNSYSSPRFIEVQDENPCTYVGDGFFRHATGPSSRCSDERDSVNASPEGTHG